MKNKKRNAYLSELFLENLNEDFLQMFSDGFKLGVKMMIEVLYSEDKMDTTE